MILAEALRDLGLVDGIRRHFAAAVPSVAAALRSHLAEVAEINAAAARARLSVVEGERQ